MVLHDLLTNQKQHISTPTTMHMAIKPGRVVIYSEGHLPITSHGPSSRWSCEVTYQVKYVKSQLALD